MKQSYKNAELEIIGLEENDIITDSNLTKKFIIQSGAGDNFNSNDDGLFKFFKNDP